MTDTPSDDLLDVVEVEFAKPHRIRVIARNKTFENAEAIVDMAVIRRGVEAHFFTTTPAGRYRDEGDVLSSDERPLPDDAKAPAED